MTIGKVLGLISIILGFVVAIVDEKILVSPLEWFLVAIAFVVVLDGVALPFGRRQG
jgi:hypothetical protein